MTTTNTSYNHDTTLKLGENRGKPRVWLEGTALAKAGFLPGTKFTATFTKGLIVFEPSDFGDRTVSGRTRDEKELPIIDINAAQITQSMGDAPRIAVKMTYRRIEITPSRVSLAKAARVLTALAVGLFVGGGLMSQAAKAAGFNTAAAVEIDDNYAAVHESNHGGHTFNTCVSEVDLGRVKAKGPIGFFHAGIPCEPFSVIRRNNGANVKTDKALVPEAHELGDMTFWALRAIDYLNPHTGVLEEVPKWLDSGAGWMARHALTRMGYHVDARIIDAADFGSVTSRKRAYLVFTSHDKVNWPTPFVTTQVMADILHPADDPRCEWFTRETPSKSWLFDHWAKQTAKGNGFASALIRYTDTRVGTIKKRYFAGQGDNQVVVHPHDENRYRWMTIDEVSRVMGLPTGYDLGPTKTSAGEILGQGVEVGVLTSIIKSVTQQS